MPGMKYMIWCEVITFIGSVLLMHFHKMYVPTMLVAAYLSFSTVCDMRMRKMFTIANYIAVAVMVVFYFYNGRVSPEALVFCVICVILGFVGVFGSGDGFVMCICGMYMSLCTTTFIITAMMFICISCVAFIAYCLIIAVFKREPEQKLFDGIFKTKRAFVPALSLALVLVLTVMR